MLQIVAMETELKKAGKLNTIQDVKEFWDDMLAPPSTPAVQVHRASYKSCKCHTQASILPDVLLCIYKVRICQPCMLAVTRNLACIN